MENKKILFLCQYFYPEKISSGVLPFELAEYLVSKNYQVNALVGYPKEYSDKENTPFKEVAHGVNIRRVRYIQSDRSNFFGRIMNYLGLCLSMVFHPKSFLNNDIYICYTNPPLLPFVATLFKKIFQKKMILVIYDLYPDVAIKLNIIKSNGIISNTFNMINKYVYNNVEKIIVLSTEMKDYLCLNKSIDSTRIEVIANWYKELNNSIIKNDSHILRILYGGNMGLAQEFDTLIQTMIDLKDYQDIEFQFAGHGVKKEEIESIKKKYNLENCYIYNFLPKEEYERLLIKADIVIVTLNQNAWGLGSPSKVYSYLAAGKPIIAIMPSNTDIVKDIREYNNGCFIEIGNVQELTSTIMKIKDNKEILNDLSKQSIKLFNEKYRRDICCHKYEIVIEEM